MTNSKLKSLVIPFMVVMVKQYGNASIFEVLDPNDNSHYDIHLEKVDYTTGKHAGKSKIIWCYGDSETVEEMGIENEQGYFVDSNSVNTDKKLAFYFAKLYSDYQKENAKEYNADYIQELIDTVSNFQIWNDNTLNVKVYSNKDFSFSYPAIVNISTKTKTTLLKCLQQNLVPNFTSEITIGIVIDAPENIEARIEVNLDDLTELGII